MSSWLVMAGLSSSLQAAEPLCTDAVNTAVQPSPSASTLPVSARRSGGGQYSGDDDSDPGFGTFPAPSRPKPPRPLNPRNAMASNRLRRKSPHAKSVRVTDYQYRYYDQLTGRWPSRDPIEEVGGINLYAFVGNDGINKWDVLGLEFKGTYSITTKELKLIDKDRKNKFSRKDNVTCECEGSSGDNNFKNINASGTGPLPPGKYLVVSPHHDIAGNTTYVLDPIDSKQYNDRWDNHPDGISRGLFRIHLEITDAPRGGSNGCMVFDEGELKALKGSVPEIVKIGWWLVGPMHQHGGV